MRPVSAIYTSKRTLLLVLKIGVRPRYRHRFRHRKSKFKPALLSTSKRPITAGRESNDLPTATTIPLRVIVSRKTELESVSKILVFLCLTLWSLSSPPSLLLRSRTVLRSPPPPSYFEQNQTAPSTHQSQSRGSTHAASHPPRLLVTLVAYVEVASTLSAPDFFSSSPVRGGCVHTRI